MNTQMTTRNNISKDNRELQRARSFHPFSIMDRFFDDNFFDPFNNMLPSVFGPRMIGGLRTSFPQVDVEETEKEIKVTANIPGIDPKNINVEVGDDYLSLSGKIERENKDSKGDGKLYRLEREYGEFRREFTLPSRVDREKIVAKSKNGVLTVTLPKIEEEKKKRVEIEIE